MTRLKPKMTKLKGVVRMFFYPIFIPHSAGNADIVVPHWLAVLWAIALIVCLVGLIALFANMLLDIIFCIDSDALTRISLGILVCGIMLFLVCLMLTLFFGK